MNKGAGSNGQAAAVPRRSPGRLAYRKPAYSRENAFRDDFLWPPEPCSIRPRPREAGSDTLGDPRPLELRNGREDMHLQLAGWRRRVDALLQADERHAQRLELVEQGDEVLQAAPQLIEPPADDEGRRSAVVGK